MRRTKKEDNYIRKHYLFIPSKRIAAHLGISDTFVRNRRTRLGLVIPQYIIDNFKKDSQIKKGNIPSNKGKRMSKAMYKRCKPTMFKKGNLPAQTLYNGAITIHYGHKERGCPPYKWIRLSKANWEMLHVHNWKKKHSGKIKKGYIVAFKTIDTMNCKVSNLMLITRKQNMARNTIQRYPEELKKTMRALGKLKRTITKLQDNGKK